MAAVELGDDTHLDLLHHFTTLHFTADVEPSTHDIIHIQYFTPPLNLATSACALHSNGESCARLNLK